MKSIVDNIKWKKILLFISIAILFLVFEIIYIIIGIDLESITMNQFIGLSFIKYFFFIIIFIILYHKYLKEKWLDFRINLKKYLFISSRDWFTGFLIMMASNLIINSFIPGLGENENNVQTIISLSPYLALIMTTFLAPFVEEMIFRKSLQDCFKNKYLFMIISGLIFGVIHVMGSSNPLEYLLIIPYGALGFMFAKTLDTTDNIYCTVMMHMFHNGILTLLALVVR